MDINVSFCRTLLRSVMKDINPVTTVAERKSAWVYHFGRGHWEFHGPDEFYWDGRADNAYDARAKGWLAWWESLEKEGAKMRSRLNGQRLRAVAVANAAA